MEFEPFALDKILKSDFNKSRNMKRPIFTNDHVYHVYNRGVEKRITFTNDRDYLRCIHDLYEFNDQEPALNLGHFLTSQPSSKNIEVGLRYFQYNKPERPPRKLLVEILAFCLMPNHYHLLLRQKKDNGISTFMQKFGTGYTNYFNLKYERVGPLFQGKFKAVEVETDAQLLHLPYYIHLNPVELVEPRWKDRIIKNWKGTITFLESYRWSSYLDYIGKKNFPSVTSREWLTDIIGTPSEYKKATAEWLKELNLDTIRDVIID